MKKKKTKKRTRKKTRTETKKKNDIIIMKIWIKKMSQMTFILNLPSVLSKHLPLVASPYLILTSLKDIILPNLRACEFKISAFDMLQERTNSPYSIPLMALPLSNLRTCACFPVTSVPRVASAAVRANSIRALRVHVTGGS